ncbi:MAG: 2-oxoacid:acceptor oxidoreductase family protein, partial [Deltaproteobacteria bacterium]|nr:2-oxoacid:acceptor oxidoreductase family protein [Deltaproteobacteria bacterium]
MTIKQQIIISGVGGQGVLFVTRLLAEAAMMKGYPVLTSETHGMAQRGGTVVSH